jgi:hypothetical protein
MVADFMNYRPSPEEAPTYPLWLRPTAALGGISCHFGHEFCHQTAHWILIVVDHYKT